MAFAKEVLGLVETMKQSKHGQPELPLCLPTVLETFTTMTWSQDGRIWEFVDIPQLFNYLRCARALRIPTEWKSIVPKSLLPQVFHK